MQHHNDLYCDVIFDEIEMKINQAKQGSQPTNLHYIYGMWHKRKVATKEPKQNNCKTFAETKSHLRQHNR
jgi:hypothetical protein